MKKDEGSWIWVTGIVLLLTLLWWWNRKKTSSASPATAAAPAPAPTAAPTSPDLPDLASSGPTILDPPVDTQGSSLTMSGFAPGDVNATTLSRDRLAPETVAMLNRHVYYSGMGGGVSLYDWYEDAAKHGQDTSAAQAQIRDIIARYIENPSSNGF